VDYDEIYNQNLLNGGIENAERIIQSDIIKEFSLSEKAIGVTVSVEVKNDTMELTEVRLILRDESILTDPRELITYVNQRLLCPCVVVYD
jgi:hypothetical protein